MQTLSNNNLARYSIYDNTDNKLFGDILNTKNLDQIITKLVAPAKICITWGSGDSTTTLASDMIAKGLMDNTNTMISLEITKFGDYQNRAYARCTYLSGWNTAVEKIAVSNNGSWQAAKTLTN